jgi:DNA-binding MarR family transcriptional regulator
VTKPRTSSTPNTPRQSLTDVVTDRICRLSDAIIKFSAGNIKHLWDIRHTDLRLLNTLDNNARLSVNEISQRTLVDQAWVSRSLRELELKNLVTRRKHPGDGRITLISLTAKGKRLLEKVRPYAERSEAYLLQGLNERQLKRILDVLENNTERMLQDMKADLSDKP